MLSTRFFLDGAPGFSKRGRRCGDARTMYTMPAWSRGTADQMPLTYAMPAWPRGTAGGAGAERPPGPRRTCRAKGCRRARRAASDLRSDSLIKQWHGAPMIATGTPYLVREKRPMLGLSSWPSKCTFAIPATIRFVLVPMSVHVPPSLGHATGQWSHGSTPGLARFLQDKGACKAFAAAA